MIVKLFGLSRRIIYIFEITDSIFGESNLNREDQLKCLLYLRCPRFLEGRREWVLGRGRRVLDTGSRLVVLNRILFSQDQQRGTPLAKFQRHLSVVPYPEGNPGQQLPTGNPREAKLESMSRYLVGKFKFSWPLVRFLVDTIEIPVWRRSNKYPILRRRK